MKKITIFILSLTIVLGLSSCDFFKSTTNDFPTSLTSTEDLTTNSQFTTNETTADITSTEIITTEIVSTDVVTTDNVTTNIVTTDLVTTTKEYDRYQYISFYSLNDFHGGTYSDIANLENIGAYFKDRKANDENTIILSNGDIFQGAPLSNYYHGEPIVDVFNNIGMDGFIIGNHEFDWGIDEILKYKDGDSSNGEMDSPILAANIVYKDTQQPLSNTVPYIIKEVSGVKVGVIGLIGEVIDSISATMVSNIEFLDPSDAAYDIAYDLRENQDCDIVVVYIHYGSSINYELASFTGQHKIDAVFNGHTHANEADSLDRTNEYDAKLFYAQSDNRNSLFSNITLAYDTLNDEVVSGSASTYEFYYIDDYFDSDIESILLSYMNDPVYVDIISEYLSTSTGYFSKDVLAKWGSSVIRDYAGLDVGASNVGGYRHSISYGDITMGDLIELYPFDNYINTCKMTGAQLLDFYNERNNENYDIVFDDGFYYLSGHLYINGVMAEADTLYTVGAVDYIFNKTDYNFLEGQDIQITTLLMRDLLAQDLKNTNNSFNPSLGTSYQDIDLFYDFEYLREIERLLYI